MKDLYIVIVVEYLYDFFGNEGYDEVEYDYVEDLVIDVLVEDYDYDYVEGEDGYEGYNYIEGFNEYVWFDLYMMIYVVEVIVDELFEFDFDGVEEFVINVDVFVVDFEGFEIDLEMIKVDFVGINVFIIELFFGYFVVVVGLIDVMLEGFVELVEEGVDVVFVVLFEFFKVIESG